mmetsp:Transcript_56251/g.150294  ORF Transcript_56251/g.150294 Transcript_56251/m.150294 type:complete len:236 (+) Transcript_56251:630-1337(+)
MRIQTLTGLRPGNCALLVTLVVPIRKPVKLFGERKCILIRCKVHKRVPQIYSVYEADGQVDVIIQAMETKLIQQIHEPSRGILAGNITEDHCRWFRWQLCVLSGAVASMFFGAALAMSPLLSPLLTPLTVPTWIHALVRHVVVTVQVPRPRLWTNIIVVLPLKIHNSIRERRHRKTIGRVRLRPLSHLSGQRLNVVASVDVAETVSTIRRLLNDWCHRPLWHLVEVQRFNFGQRI